MKRILFLLTLITTNSYGQTRDKFDISEVFNKASYNRADKNHFKVDRNNIFEDSTYIVSKSCSGEWGGTIRFKNKKTGITYSAASTCPVVVNKVNGSYIVTNTLAHMRGFSEIIEIRNPEVMGIFELPKLIKKKAEVVVQYVGDNEAKSTKGTTQLIDTIGVLTLATFLHHGQLYHIVTDFRKTYLTQIVSGKFVILDTVSNESLWTYDPEVLVTSERHSFVFFDNDKASGYLDIFDNKIKVVRRK